MALIKFGGGVVGMAGKIAGNVYARNRYGQYARSWAKPTNPRTALQTAVRALASTLGDAWQSALTDAQREAWRDYAAAVPMKNRLGETMLLSGFNHYYRSNAALLNAGLPRVDDGPTVLSLPAQDPTFAIAATAATGQIAVTFDDTADWVSEDDAALMLSIGAPQNSNIQFFGGPWRYAGNILGDNGTPLTSPQNVATPFALTAGQKVFARARIVRADGRLSEFFRDDAISG